MDRGAKRSVTIKKGNGLGTIPPIFLFLVKKGEDTEPLIMKASLKLRRDREGQRQEQKQPIVKAKLPFDLLGFPVHVGFKVCGHIQELALRLSSAHQAAGPSLQVSYRPHEPDCPFTLSFKAGFSPWPSSPASIFTMAAEVNLSRPSNPTLLLRVKPQLGDFSFSHDFRSEIRGGSAAKNGDHMRCIDSSPSGMSFTNAFARYASKLHLSDKASSPWHDSITNEIFDAGQHLQYDAVGNANRASFDSTPYASERASFARFDLANLSSDHPKTPFEIFMEEKRFPDMGQLTSFGRDCEPLRDHSSSQNPVATCRTSRMDDDWERIGDAVSRSITTESSSTQVNRDSAHANLHQHSGSRSASSLAGRAVCGLSGGSHLWACTRLPISPEAHIKIRWSVSAYTTSSSSKVPLLPLLLLDKVSLEAVAPCTGLNKKPTSITFSSAPRDETHPENVMHKKQVEISLAKKAKEESMSDGGPDVAGLEGEIKEGQELHSNNVNMKKTSLFGQFLRVTGLFG